MEQIETQVSDLRSFLPGAPPAAAAAANPTAAGEAAVPIPIGMAGGAMTVGGFGPAAALTSTPRHPSQSAGSPVSAVGSNSAHPSPLPYNPNHDAAQSQPTGSLNPPSLSGGATATATGAGATAAPPLGPAAAGAKRKQDGGLDDASAQKQQRSKRNRVSGLYTTQLASCFCLCDAWKWCMMKLTMSLVCLVHLDCLVSCCSAPSLPYALHTRSARYTNRGHLQWRSRHGFRIPRFRCKAPICLDQANLMRFCPSATNASAARSSAMARLRARDAATSACPVSMLPIAAPTALKTRTSSER